MILFNKIVKKRINQEYNITGNDSGSLRKGHNPVTFMLPVRVRELTLTRKIYSSIKTRMQVSRFGLAVRH